MVKNLLRAVLLAAAVGSCRRAAAPDAPFQGLVEFDERALSFDVGGRVMDVRAVRGAMLRAGERVATLDDLLERPQRDARAADLEAARAQLALLRAGSRPEDIRGASRQLQATRVSEDVVARTLARQRALISAGSMPPATLDELENQLAQLQGQRDVQAERLAALRHGSRPEEIAMAVARVDAARATLVAMDTRLEHFTLASPSSGVILDVPAKTGEVVSPGAPVATLGDVDHPYVDVFVPEERIGAVRLGGSARVRIDAVPLALPGVDEHVGEQTEFTPRYLFSDRERWNLVVRVRVRVLDPDHRLRAGVPAFVSFVAGQT